MIRNARFPRPEEIREGLSPLYSRAGLRLAVLFGSAVTGKTTGESDIDLALLFDGPWDTAEAADEATRLLHRTVDVVDLRRAGPLLAFAAATKGRILFERSPGLFNEFLSLAFRRHIDARKLYDSRAAVIRRFLDERRPA